MLKFQRGFWKQQSLLDLIQQILGPSSADCSLVTQRHSPQSQGPPRRSLLRLAQLSILLMVNLDRMSLILAYAFRITYLVTIPFGVIVVLMSMFVRDPSRYFTKHIAVHLEKEVIGKKHVDEGKASE